MRPGLQRDLVRDQTAYRLGRAVVDGFTLAAVVVSVGGVGLMCVWLSRNEAVERWSVVGVIFAAFVLSAGAILQREVLHALFDLADCALLGRREPERRRGENPFGE